MEGTIGWQLPEPPKNAQLFLLWHTIGKGDEDLVVVKEVNFDQQSPAHEATFQIRLPDSPYSFEGHLISLQWTIEFTINNGEVANRVDILVSPWVTPVVLNQNSSDE